MQRLREAFRTVLSERMRIDFEKGVYDNVLQMFVEGRIDPEQDSITIELRVDTIPNDILVFRVLAGFEKDEAVIERVRAMWRNEAEQ